jgi:hypothetical protein
MGMVRQNWQKDPNNGIKIITGAVVVTYVRH